MSDTPRTCKTCRHAWRKGTHAYDSGECRDCVTVNGNPGWQANIETLERELADSELRNRTLGKLVSASDAELSAATARAEKAEADCAAMRSERDEARRQVEALANMCSGAILSGRCNQIWSTLEWREWAANEARKVVTE